jgi:16S rRNA (adenine1518-N6/adenine1519-N6)-dimethyltransferase
MATESSAKKSLGQHWLHDKPALQAIARAANVELGDTVLEIGPGTGTLTHELLGLGANVIALEYDSALADALPARLQGVALQTGQTLQVKEGDIRRYDLGALPMGYKVVANIPYYLTAYLLRLLTDTHHKPRVASLLVQKEVAERVAAKPGQMSLISVMVQFYYEVSLGIEVPAHLFEPPPKVDSQVLILRERPEPLFPTTQTDPFFRIVKAGFSTKRKTLLNTLSGGLQLSRQNAANLLGEAGISPQARAQELSLDDWHKLYKAYI